MSNAVETIATNEGWVTAPLSDVADLKGGFAFKSKEYTEAGIPILRMGNITKEFQINWNKKTQPYFPEERVDEFADYLLEGGELIICLTDMSNTGHYLGTVAINTRRALLNQRVSKFLFDESVINKKLLYYALCEPECRHYMISDDTGSLQKNTSHKHVLSYEITFPKSLEQQERIVAKIEELFSHIDAGIEALKKAKQLLKQYRQSVLKAAVTGKVMDLKSGMIKFELGEVIKIKSGQNLTKKAMDESGEYYVYGGNGISGRHNEYMFEESKLIIGRVGAHCGNVHITKPNSWVTDNAFVVEFDEEKYSMGFLRHLLTSINLNQYSNSTAQPVISGKTIYPVDVSVPEKNDQILLEEYIDQRFDSINRLENEIDSQLLKTVTNKQSVLASAFSGSLGA